MTNPSEANFLQKAIECAGSQVALAKALGCTYQTIQGWRAKGSPPPARAVQIEKVTNGKVKRHELRPDIFDEPTQAAKVA